MAQDGPRWPQDGPKLAPRWPKMPQDGSRWPRECACTCALLAAPLGAILDHVGEKCCGDGLRWRIPVDVEQKRVELFSLPPRRGRKNARAHAHSWRHLGASWGHLRAILGPLGASWRLLGPSWGHPEAILGPSWVPLGHLSGLPGAPLVLFWSLVDPS